MGWRYWVSSDPNSEKLQATCDEMGGGHWELVGVLTEPEVRALSGELVASANLVSVWRIEASA